MDVDTPQSLKALKATELKEKCVLLSLDSKGTKKVLLERIFNFYGFSNEDKDVSETSEKLTELTSNELEMIDNDLSPQKQKTPITFKNPNELIVEKTDFELDYNNEDMLDQSPARIERIGSDDSYVKAEKFEGFSTKKDTPCSENNEDYEVKYMDHVHLDPYVNDSHFIMCDDKYLCGSQIVKNELSNFWCGVKATHGISSGSAYFTCKYLNNLTRDNGFLRVGFSSASASLHLGDSNLSCGYDSSGRIYSNMKVVGSAKKFNPGDSITILVTISPTTTIFSFFLNDEDVGHTVNIDVDQPSCLFPHVYFKNVKFQVDFSPRTNFPNYSSFDTAKKLIAGPRPPLSCAECELLMMVGVMGSGKSTWVKQFLKETAAAEKRYDVIGRITLFNRWRLIGNDRNLHLSERLVSQALSKIISIASKRARNYVIDQTNYMSNTRKKRIGFFNHFGVRKAVVVMPRLSELAKRIEQYKVSLNDNCVDNRHISFSELADFKANITLPTVEEGFTDILYVDCDENSVAEVLADYKYDAKIYKESHPNIDVKRMGSKIPRILPPQNESQQYRNFQNYNNRNQYRRFSPQRRMSPNPFSATRRKVDHDYRNISPRLRSPPSQRLSSGVHKASSRGSDRIEHRNRYYDAPYSSGMRRSPLRDTSRRMQPFNYDHLRPFPPRRESTGYMPDKYDRRNPGYDDSRRQHNVGMASRLDHRSSAVFTSDYTRRPHERMYNQPQDNHHRYNDRTDLNVSKPRSRYSEHPRIKPNYNPY